MSEETKNSGSNKGRKLFSDVSTVQVVSTALAAVTSMFLASYIGIVGSLIGAGIASIISTLAASLYKKLLADSTEKIKELSESVVKKVPLGSILPGSKDHDDNANADSDAEGVEHTSGNAPETAIPKGSEAIDMNAQVIALASSDGVEAAPLDEAPGKADILDKKTSAESLQTLSAAISQKPEHSGQTDAARKIKDEEERLKHRTRNLIVVCVVSALIAVAASAALIYTATTGEGIGAKPKSITEVLQRVDFDDDRSSQTDSNQNAADNGSSSNDQDDSDSDATNDSNTTANNAANSSNNASNKTSNSNTSTNTNMNQNTNAGSNTNTSVNTNTSSNTSTALGNTSSSSNISSGSSSGTGTPS